MRRSIQVKTSVLLIKNYLSSDEYAAEKMRRATAGASLSMAGDHSLMATYTVAPADNESNRSVDSPCDDENVQQLGAENESVSRGDQLRRALRSLSVDVKVIE